MLDSGKRSVVGFVETLTVLDQRMCGLSGSVASMVEVLFRCLIMRMATNESIPVGRSVCTVAIQLSIATAVAFRYNFCFERPGRITCLVG